MTEPTTAEALSDISAALVRLGLNNAMTDMGAIEALSKEVLDAGTGIAQGLHDIADAIREARPASDV